MYFDSRMCHAIIGFYIAQNETKLIIIFNWEHNEGDHMRLRFEINLSIKFNLGQKI